jgi:hypothetical protein
MDTHTKFRANDNVSRQEAAKILAVMAQRAFGKMPTVSCDVTYKDEASFDSTLQASIYASCSLGLMKGSNGRFMPNATLTRGQAIAILMRNADQWLDETDSKDRWQPYVHRARALGYLSFDSTANFNAAITRHELIEWAHSIYLRSSVDN